ncbi:hypothetical protein DZA65_02209 [Dickeya dianthicola]|uniref:Uncharacterized protein n=1 Tax=Dickeya dianthicola TaxID=204039 RepID=A0AAP2GDV7_9GAMM|nr:hypothetical protein [Dickeya dianthicola]ATO33182.1 hypothetical protein DDI_2014 [Dickeya dianthicola RNS04.9]AYC19096.1 hypothetical protein DZA65_02209 [Dickeya dianthicola]MBI0438037.1 hypothetical protein [Dickeya dianthicola]MBI0448549.1 hypothetical protein [Dickeya dianthicola]MBI0452920.1 hypothetical protein [Dickeya dianthicola]
MSKGVITKGLCGLLLTVPLYGFADNGFADNSNPDLIAGYTSQQLADALPTVVDGLKRQKVEVDAKEHSVQGEYVDTATKRKALVTVYMPPLANGQTVAGNSELDIVVASSEKEMLRQRIRPEKKELVADGAPKFRCLLTILNDQVVHSLCSAVVKGRIVEIQPVTLVDNKMFEPAQQRQASTVLAIGKSLAAAK